MPQAGAGFLLTSSPCLEGPGIPTLTSEPSCFVETCSPCFRLVRSYSLSTGSHRESLGQDISRSVEVAIVVDATRGAGPLSLI